MHEKVQLSKPGELEYSSDNFFAEGLNCPQRPEGCEAMSVPELEAKENTEVR